MSILKDIGLNAANGVINSVFGALSAARNNRYAEQQAHQAFQYQKQENEQIFQQNRQLAQEQNQMNLDQWNRENAYNTPTAQMQRFMAAGLNPDLIYGQSNMSANSPTLTAGTPKETANYAQSKFAALQQSAQLQNTFAQNRLLSAQARNLNAQAASQEQDARFKDASFEDSVFGVQLENAVKDSIASLNDEKRKHSFEDRHKIRWQTRQIQKYVDNFDTYLNEVRSKTKLMDEQQISEGFNRMLELDKYKLLEKETISKLMNDQQWRMTQAETRSYLRSQVAYLGSQTLYTNELSKTEQTLRPIKGLDIIAGTLQKTTQTRLNQSQTTLTYKQADYTDFQKFNESARTINGYLDTASKLFTGSLEVLF